MVQAACRVIQESTSARQTYRAVAASTVPLGSIMLSQTQNAKPVKPAKRRSSTRDSVSSEQATRATLPCALCMVSPINLAVQVITY